MPNCWNTSASRTPDTLARAKEIRHETPLVRLRGGDRDHAGSRRVDLAVDRRPDEEAPPGGWMPVDRGGLSSLCAGQGKDLQSSAHPGWSTRPAGNLGNADGR